METKDLPGHYRHGGEVRSSRSAAPTKKTGAAAMLASMAGPRGYADGGVVQAVKGFFGIKPKPEPLPADLNKLPPTGAGPAPAPSQPKPKEEPKKAISQYNGMSALERRMKEADAYADGGMVRGPGTGTSDDVKDKVREGTYIMPADSTKEIGAGALSKMSKVPVKLSNGEYKLTPEQVHAIGVQTLEGMKDATHKPVRKAYADGGMVGDEARRVPGAPGVSRQGNSYTQSTVADAARQPGLSMGAGTYAPKPAAQSAPAAQSVQSPQRPAQNGGASGGWDAAKPASASSAMAAMPTETSGWRTKAVLDGAAQDAQAAWDRGSPMAAAGTVVRGALGAIPAAFVDAGQDVANVVGKPIGNFYDGLTGSGASAANPTQAEPVKPAVAAPAATSQAQTQAAAPAPAATAPNPASQPAAAPKPAAAGPLDGTGITKTMGADGRTTYSNVAGGGQMAGGSPSPQNIGAAEALASRSTGQPADVMGIYARASEALKGVAEAQRALDDYGPRMSGGGDLLKGGRASQQQFQQDSLRTALVQQAQQGGRGAAAAMQALNGMEGNQIQRETAQMREQGDAARFNAREAGETTREGMRSAAGARRDGLTAELGRGKLDLDRQAQGYANRTADRQEKLYADYDAAKTPEEKSAIAQKIRDLAGKTTDPKDNFMAVGGGQEWDPKGAAMRNVPQRLIDLRTGKEVGGGQQEAAASAPKAGEVRGGYKFKGGNPADQNSWEKV